MPLPTKQGAAMAIITAQATTMVAMTAADTMAMPNSTGMTTTGTTMAVRIMAVQGTTMAARDGQGGLKSHSRTQGPIKVSYEA